MRVTCIGGGPAGLYFALLAKQRFPDWSVKLLERNRPDDTFGWGVVFSDATLDALRRADEPTQVTRTLTFSGDKNAVAHGDERDVNALVAAGFGVE